MNQLQRTPAELGDARRFPDLQGLRAQPPLSASHYLLVLTRQRWRILAFVGTCVLVTFLISSRLTPVYEATARIDVDRRVPSSVIGPDANTGSSSTEDADQFMATQMELMKSDAVLRPVAQQFHLWTRENQFDGLTAEQAKRRQEAPVVLKHLNIARPVNTYLIRISYRSVYPKLAADVANAVAQSYLEHTYDVRLHSSSALSEFMEKQTEELKAKMERSSMALAKFEQQLNVINPEEKTNILSARLLQLNTEYTNAQADRVRKQAAFEDVHDASFEASQVSNQNEELSKLYERLNQAKQHFTEVSSIYGPNHSEYRKTANEVAEVQRQFDEMRQNVGQRVQADYRQSLAREQMLQRAVAQTKAEYDSLNSRSFEYQQLKREADADKVLYSDLERRIREAGINSGFQGNAIRIADYARPPDRPVFPRKGLFFALAFLVSAIIATCVAIFGDVLDMTVRDPEQAERALDTTVIGTLPAVKEMSRTGNAATPILAPPRSEPGVHSASIGLVRYSGQRRRGGNKGAEKGYRRYGGIGSFEEAIRTLRHSILLPDFDRRVRSLLLTSAAPGEGKTTATVHLAIAHAEQGKRTLVIDADLRRPAIHRRLGVMGTPGLSELLLGEIHWNQAVQRNPKWPDLDIIAAGTASRRASDLIDSSIAELVEQARQEYDLILIDAPPLLGFAEAMQVATAVDGVVVLARSRQTSRRAVARALASLRQLRANVLGLVLNEVDRDSSDGYYYYDDYRQPLSEAAKQA